MQINQNARLAQQASTQLMVLRAVLALLLEHQTASNVQLVQLALNASQASYWSTLTPPQITVKEIAKSAWRLNSTTN